MSELVAPAKGLKRGQSCMDLNPVSLCYPGVDAETTNNSGAHKTHLSVRTFEPLLAAAGR